MEAQNAPFARELLGTTGPERAFARRRTHSLVAAARLTPSSSHKTLGGRAGAKDYAASLYLLCRKSKRGESTLTDLIEKCELASAVVVANMGVEDVNRKAVEKACKGVCKVVWEDSDEETTAPGEARASRRVAKRQNAPFASDRPKPRLASQSAQFARLAERLALGALFARS